ncbi:nuclear transport factor 2 family protein [Chryseolinea sp. T2]|uniref:nuclear transport factor 2 family protein n=1 Tax=Chryseolinea sp. T2 TaxID=3129255 RepID=UPI00307788A3
MNVRERGLLQQSLAWDEAIVSNDVSRIRSFMTEDWICVATHGGTTNVDSFLDQIAQGELTHTEMSAEESQVRIYNEAGIVIGKGYSKGTFRGKQFSFYEWSVSVFILKDDSWKCVLTMLADA